VHISLMAVLFLGCTPAAEESPALAEAPIERPSSDRITFERVSVHASAETATSALRAASIVYRNRKGAAGFVTYHDLAEVFATDARLSIELNASEGFSSIPEAMESLLALDVEELSVEGESPAEPRSASESGNGATDRVGATRWPTVTRFVFEGLAIDRVSPGVEVSLEAKRGRYDIGAGTLLLEGGVVMRTSESEELRAARAVLSREHDGLYFPLGYQRKGKPTPQSAFVVLDERGEFSATRGAGRIAYEDLIDKRERLVLLHYAERAPPALRPLLVAILSGMRANRP
jgi:hypothetical protein